MQFYKVWRRVGFPQNEVEGVCMKYMKTFLLSYGCDYEKYANAGWPSRHTSPAWPATTSFIYFYPFVIAKTNQSSKIILDIIVILKYTKTRMPLTITDSYIQVFKPPVCRPWPSWSAWHLTPHRRLRHLHRLIPQWPLLHPLTRPTWSRNRGNWRSSDRLPLRCCRTGWYQLLHQKAEWKGNAQSYPFYTQVRSW